jgi:cell surface hyaluronidase
MCPGLRLTPVGSLLKTPSRSSSRVRCAVALGITLSYLALAGCSGDSESSPGATAPPLATATPTVHVNQPPVLAPLADHDVPLGSDLLVAVSATDPDGDPVTLSTSTLPENSYFLPASGIFCFFDSTEAQLNNPIEVTFIASDGQASTTKTITIHVVPQGTGGVVGTPPGFVLDPIGDRSVHVGDTLTIQLSASGASPIAYKMHPEPAIAPFVSLNPTTGLFQFTPAVDQAGKRFEVTLQACVPDNNDCSATAQVHETIHISVLAQMAGCPDYVPASCTELAPGMTLPQPLTSCYVVKQAGAQPYVNENINILKNGALYFVEDPGKTIDFRVKSVLVEFGGTLDAGSATCPFGKQGGKLTIGIYGTDPSDEARVPSPTPGIQCMTNPGSDAPCFPAGRDPMNGTFYCTLPNTDDPCASTMPPTDLCSGYPSSPTKTCPNNYLLEHYGNLNFDPTSFGYKVLGVSYGGTLNLFGYKGALPLQSADGAKIAAGEDDHCVVPTQAGLDAAEMRAWANLSGSSWGRLDGLNDARTQLTLDRPVKDWQPGDQIVVGTTDWYPGHNELRTIRSVSGDGTMITVCRPIAGGTGPGGCPASAVAADALDYPHYASIFDARTLAGAEYTQSGLNRTAVDLRATVGLLSRSIQIRSLGATADQDFPSVDQCMIKMDGTNPGPSCYFGGHIMVRQGFKEAQIQGVEFKQLGQGGRIGHYPVHFHLAKNAAYTGKKAFVKDSAVWDSMTRFMVLHGTHDVTLSRNVGFASIGHGYYLEDASEIDDRLCYNLGISARGALKEFFEAQAQPANWAGSPPAPSLLARYVPPILDGVCAGPTSDKCLSQNSTRVPTLRLGSDTFMPVMFWTMNAANELVGNAAVGVHGLGGCYWLLSSGVSGPSVTHQFDGLAKYNVTGDHQAPLRRFRGNTCMTAATALSAQAEIPPATFDPMTQSPYSAAGFTAIQNPYLFDKDGKPKPPDVLDKDFSRPAVTGNFQPIEPNTAGTGGGLFSNCAQLAKFGTQNSSLAPNTKSCVVSVIDRFATSYNWAQVNFSSVWLRPWFYLFSNAAITDQLFGGLTFVTGGSWFQVPPAYFSIAKNGLYIGTSQDDAKTNRYAQRSGPIFPVNASTPLNPYPPCSRGDRTTCNIDLEGTGYWQGSGFNPKRLISIYDGPHFADGNLFVNVGAWKCAVQPCQGKQPGQCNLPDGLECGIYGSTTEPTVEGMNHEPDPSKMLVIDAAVGWKQNNGFYYPPAFAYRHSAFFKKVPPALQSLNNCVDSAGVLSPGSCRHNVVDRTLKYISGNMQALDGGPTIYGAGQSSLGIGPIDFQTFLGDLDASLTGASGVIPVGPECSCGASCTTADGHKGTCGRRDTGQPCRCEVTQPTTSLSRNAFFDAPAQNDECLSFGLQTSPYQFVTSVMAELMGPAVPGTTTYATNADSINWQDRPGVAIYRQWKLAREQSRAGQVCDQGVSSTERSTFMVGPNVYHAPCLTQSFPPGLGGQQGQLYYIDTSSGDLQNTMCYPGTIPFNAARFVKNNTYVIYHLFARNDAVISYQFYVGDGVHSVSEVKGNFVRLNPHLNDGGYFGNSVVTDICKPGDTGSWCGALPTPQIDDNGILTVTLDQRVIAPDFNLATRDDYERCMPRDLCFYDADSKRCEACASATAAKRQANCIRQSDFLPADIASMSTPDGTGKNPLDVVCRDWATYASGTSSNTVGDLSLIDCPKTGCLGFAFTLPDSFVGNKKYNDKGADASHCFLRSEWINDALVSRADGNDPLCPTPRPAMPTDFCDDGPAGTRTPTVTPTPTATGPTPTNTPTFTPFGFPATSTRTPTAGGATPTNTGGSTPTPTASGPTATVTPTQITPTVTPTKTPRSGGLSFNMHGQMSTNVTVPLAGMTYAPMQLDLQDGQGRFCTDPGKFPGLNVDVGSKPSVGVFPDLTEDQLGIANIPAAAAGTYDLLISTFIPCSATQPTILRMPGAITYGGS